MASESLIKQLSQSFYNIDGTPNERLEKYCSKDVQRIIIDGNEFTGYKTYSFFWEKTYVKEPTRSSDGTMGNLNSYATFITPHLQIKFSLMSIEDYRRLYKLILSKNEFLVTCYDALTNETTTNKMYFYPDSLPKLNMIARNLLNPQGEKEKWIELLGVQDYTVEMVGTNNDVEKATITYNLNVPSDIVWNEQIQVSVETPINLAEVVGRNAIIEITDTQNTTNKVATRMSNITFGDKYKFKYWAENANGSGFKYIDTDAYMFRNNTNLYAIWSKGAK